MSTRIPSIDHTVQKEAAAMRKEPRQARSKVTVEAIISAGARILSDQGWSGFTTNKVANVAGVSIGSLYQYFPDKMSLVGAIRRRHLDDCLMIMRKLGGERMPLKQFAENLVQELIAAHRLHPGLHRVLLDEAPIYKGLDDPNDAFEAEYMGHYQSAIAAYLTSAESAPMKSMALVLSDALDGVIHNAARRGMLDSVELQQQLVRMIRGYLSYSNRENSAQDSES
ncbi:TetR/AcrR family transcriptional regulator [Phyllobacterium sp. SB3]|uniref:TetR/AcrR family transcriptional regulator n=1 Tax=Phyllobacterium sp. SB3 TaxID=3156073 RepID=UPI0032AE8AEE